MKVCKQFRRIVSGTNLARTRIFEIFDKEEDIMWADRDNLDALRRCIAASTILDLAQGTLIKLVGHDPPWELNLNTVSDKDSTCLEFESDTGGQETLLQHFQGRTKRLPGDILWLIVGFVDQFPTPFKRKTLLSLSSSSKQLKSIVDPFIYSHPDITCVKTQWLFLLSLRLRPSLGSHVKCLTLFCNYDRFSINLMLLTEIASCCSSLKGLRIRDRNSPDCHEIRHCMQCQEPSGDREPLGDRECLECLEFNRENDHETSTDWHIIYMGSLFARCPQIENFRYKTGDQLYHGKTYHYPVDIVEDIPCIPFAHFHFAEGFRIAGSNLKRLDIDEDSTWLVNALLPHLSSNLTSLVIGRRNALYGARPLSTLSTQCPHLQELILGYWMWESSDVSDFVQACTNWRSTLHTLKVEQLRASDWIHKIMPVMTALRIFNCGIGWDHLGGNLAIADIASIAESKAPLVAIFLKSDDYRLARATEEMHNALADMILAHSSRLRVLSLQGFKFEPKFEPYLLKACKNAKHLRYLCFYICDETTPSEIDDLLVSCPKLNAVTEGILKCSGKKKEWAERRAKNRLPHPDDYVYKRTAYGLRDNERLIDYFTKE
ncbi:hypothetical protein FSST1_012662 [Fusarium sambucinum]